MRGLQEATPADLRRWPRTAVEREPGSRAIFSSAVLHLAALLASLLIPPVEPLEPPLPIPVTLVEPGAAGGSSGASGTATGAQSAAPTGTAAAQAPSSPQPEEQLVRETSQTPAPVAEETQPQTSPQTTVAVTPPLTDTAPDLPVPRQKPAYQAPITQTAEVPAAPPPPAEPQQTPPEPAAPTVYQPKKPIDVVGTFEGGGDSGSGAGGQSATGSGAGSGGASSGTGPGDDDYLERVRRWLNEFKEYPEAAKDRKEEGRVMVSFVLTSNGTILDPAIQRSSGSAAIDQAALDMLRRGSPVPPWPAHYGTEPRRIAMPVTFTLSFLQRFF